MTQKLYRVRPLIWQRSDLKVHEDYYFANTIFGYFTISLHNGVWQTFNDLGEKGNTCTDLESAKSACQQHFNERILQSLEEDNTLERVRAECEKEINRDVEVTWYFTGRKDIAEKLLQLITE